MTANEIEVPVQSFPRCASYREIASGSTGPEMASK